jgi:hypothetical protein
MGLGDVMQLLARHVWPVKWDTFFFHLVDISAPPEGRFLCQALNTPIIMP